MRLSARANITAATTANSAVSGTSRAMATKSCYSIPGHLNAHPRYGEDERSFRIGELKDPVVSPMVRTGMGFTTGAAKQPIAAEGRPSNYLGVIHRLPTGYFACHKHFI